MKAGIKKAMKKPRGPGKPFEKGYKGGPGRPRKEDCFGDIAREMLTGSDIDIKIKNGATGKERTISISASRSFRHGIIAAMIIESLQGNMQAAKELMDRADGKVTERMEIAEATGIDAMTAEEAQAELDAIESRTTKVETGKAKAEPTGTQ